MNLKDIILSESQDTKECIFYASVYVKFKNGQIYSMVNKVLLRVWMGRAESGCVVLKIFCLDPHGGYTGVYILKVRCLLSYTTPKKDSKKKKKGCPAAALGTE